VLWSHCPNGNVFIDCLNWLRAKSEVWRHIVAACMCCCLLVIIDKPLTWAAMASRNAGGPTPTSVNTSRPAVTSDNKVDASQASKTAW